mmetsp:Transcript_135900/g.422183  ORF Transcript_135900/g.422183 Transcript_135900/m.422183 type:complete len:495 (-) Transcript_135900:55-1539(-)
MQPRRGGSVAGLASGLLMAGLLLLSGAATPRGEVLRLVYLAGEVVIKRGVRVLLAVLALGAVVRAGPNKEERRIRRARRRHDGADGAEPPGLAAVALRQLGPQDDIAVVAGVVEEPLPVEVRAEHELGVKLELANLEDGCLEGVLGIDFVEHGTRPEVAFRELQGCRVRAVHAVGDDALGRGGRHEDDLVRELDVVLELALIVVHGHVVQSREARPSGAALCALVAHRVDVAGVVHGRVVVPQQVRVKPANVVPAPHGECPRVHAGGHHAVPEKLEGHEVALVRSLVWLQLAVRVARRLRNSVTVLHVALGLVAGHWLGIVSPHPVGVGVHHHLYVVLSVQLETPACESEVRLLEHAGVIVGKPLRLHPSNNARVVHARRAALVPTDDVPVRVRASRVDALLLDAPHHVVRGNPGLIVLPEPCGMIRAPTANIHVRLPPRCLRQSHPTLVLERGWRQFATSSCIRPECGSEACRCQGQESEHQQQNVQYRNVQP